MLYFFHDINLNSLLNQFRQNTDIHVKTIHICIIHSNYFGIMFYLCHQVFQLIQVLQNHFNFSSCFRILVCLKK